MLQTCLSTSVLHIVTYYCQSIFICCCWRFDSSCGEGGDCYPVPAVGSSLSSLGLGFLQPTIRKGMLVKTIRAKRARSTALIKVSTRLTPDDDRKKPEEEHRKILVIVAEIQDTQT